MKTSRKISRKKLLREYALGKRDFKGIHIRGQSFKDKILAKADFSGADVRDSDFTNADLEGADFSRADIRGSDFTNANLKGAKFIKSNVGLLWNRFFFITVPSFLLLVLSTQFLFLATGYKINIFTLLLSILIFLGFLSLYACLVDQITKEGFYSWRTQDQEVFKILFTDLSWEDFKQLWNDKKLIDPKAKEWLQGHELLKWNTIYVVVYKMTVAAAFSSGTLITVVAIIFKLQKFGWIGWIVFLILLISFYILAYSLRQEVLRDGGHIASRIQPSSRTFLLRLKLRVHVFALSAARAIMRLKESRFKTFKKFSLWFTGCTSFEDADLTDADFSSSDILSVSFVRSKLVRTCWYESKCLEFNMLSFVSSGSATLKNPDVAEPDPPKIDREISSLPDSKGFEGQQNNVPLLATNNPVLFTASPPLQLYNQHPLIFLPSLIATAENNRKREDEINRKRKQRILQRQLLITHKGYEQIFDGITLGAVNLCYANLQNSSFIGVDLTDANLQSADLREATLKQIRLDGANLTEARLTGACIQDWCINQRTKLDGVRCEYIYKRLSTADYPDPMRIPANNKVFEDGEFVKRLKLSDSAFDPEIDPQQLLKNVEQQLVIIKELFMGDKFEQINGSTIFNRSSVNNAFNSSVSESQKTLAEAAAEIQDLLKQLEENNPTATEPEQVAYVNIATKPDLKKRVIAALKEGGDTAIDEFILENKHLKVVKAVVKGWLDPNG